MRRITLFFALSLATLPACDTEPTDSESAESVVKSVHIERTLDEAIIHSNDGEPLWSAAPEDLIMDVVEERKQAVKICFDCNECHLHPNEVHCTGCKQVACT